MTPRAPRTTRTAAAALAAGLALGGAALATAAPAAAADVRSITLLTFNDFHGRIQADPEDPQADTVAFARTVEALRAAADLDSGVADSSLLLSTGDSVGASLFASAVERDQPTIDVLDALGLQASAVGNHEFDGGFADLRDRIATSASWEYLGANVYTEGTTEPVLPEYATFEVNGVTVGVIGAVTQETPSLVSPAGVEGLVFGDPVEAVNRVAAQLRNGDEADGEADVLVAAYHEGAPAGQDDAQPDKGLAAAMAASEVFTSIVEETSAEVAVILNGHTHQEYAFEAPVPGAPAGITRPVVQTGQYGQNIGAVQLQVDAETGAVGLFVAGLVPVGSLPLATDTPAVTEVQAIVDAALANAEEVGSQPVGSITADITTAFKEGSYGPGGYTGGTRDDRAKESALGHLVADSLLDVLSDPARGGADLALVNPGGLRSELLVAPSGDEGAGVVTYAEANAVLPFVNNLGTVDLTGDQLRQVLEQQWQTNEDGTIPSRPYLQLSVSANMSYTFDAALPQGQRITSITVDGVPVDPGATYRVGSFSFLLQGGDNFRAFGEGTNPTDSGLIDRDAWIGYLQANPDLAPDFAARAVSVTPSTTTPVVGDTVQVALAGLDLTSLGAPASTTVTATLTPAAGGTPVDLGSFPVSGGAATVTVPVPASAAPGAWVLTVTAPDSGTTTQLTLTVAAAPAPDPTPTPTPTPTPVPDPSPTATATPTPTASPSPGTGGGSRTGGGTSRSGGRTGALASTGASDGLVDAGWAAAGALLVGTALVVVVRRRRATLTQD
ncbi:bifunctional metallophosphatase/5'-nucleotidase [Cellulomonas marina]|uniref:5'-nucleotidase n=1 Tax=Cellulomonas marina TaxID=988821 RepID=A0A1I0W563_9CELL|nr:bifunctional UDP-sugar hydrolase/5'-nucleotidase [Cellulomonas marina]GIG29965.1 hypothetical protein Cma02nite_25650 [Cellulomonas marina]SFA83173.1 5'-nucleotidase [Cellulomonas marina]